MSEEFLAGLTTSARTELEALGSVDQLLAAHWEAASKGLPMIPLERDQFYAHLAERISSSSDPARALAEIEAASLALTLACANGDARALAIFDERCLGASLDRSLMRLGAGAAEIDELKQHVRMKLLVAKSERRPRITGYSGRGVLEAWVRVIAVRELLTLRRGRAREVPKEEGILTLLLPRVDPELDGVKHEYASEFRAAFEEAWHQLEVRERGVLRYSALDELSIDEIGRHYGVHRATAARWLVKARAKLLEGTRSRLMTRLDVTPEELDSILRLIQSQLDASLGSIE